MVEHLIQIGEVGVVQVSIWLRLLAVLLGLRVIEERDLLSLVAFVVFGLRHILSFLIFNDQIVVAFFLITIFLVYVLLRDVNLALYFLHFFVDDLVGVFVLIWVAQIFGIYLPSTEY